MVNKEQKENWNDDEEYEYFKNIQLKYIPEIKKSKRIIFCKLHCKEKENIYSIKEVPEKGFFCFGCENIIEFSKDGNIEILKKMEIVGHRVKILTFNPRLFEDSQLKDLDYLRRIVLEQFKNLIKQFKNKNIIFGENRIFFFHFWKYKSGNYFLRLIMHKDKTINGLTVKGWKIGKVIENKKKQNTLFDYDEEE